MKKAPKKYTRSPIPSKNLGDGELFFKNTLGTLLLTLAVAGSALLLSSLVLFFVPNPLSLVLPAGLFTTALTALVGGYFATRIYHLPALSAGLINGILLTLLALLFSLLFTKNAEYYATGYSAAVSAILHAGVVGLSIGGAFLGARERMPNKKRRRKRR